MTKKRTLDPEMIDSVAQNMFYALPLIKKRLLHMDMVQKDIVDEREYLADICAAQRRENKHKAYDNAQQRLQIALVVAQKEGLEFISHEVA